MKKVQNRIEMCVSEQADVRMRTSSFFLSENGGRRRRAEMRKVQVFT